MRIHRHLGSLALIASLGTLASCGDDSPTISKEDFLTKGNALCADLDAVLEEGGAALGNEPSEEEFAEFITGFAVPRIRDMFKAMRDLGIPEGDEDIVKSLFDDTEDVVDAIEADPSLMFSEVDPFDDTDRRAVEYGLTSCGD